MRRKFVLATLVTLLVLFNLPACNAMQSVLSESSVNPGRQLRQLEVDLDTQIKDSLNDWARKPGGEKDDDRGSDKDNMPPPAPRTATGGIINTLMVALTFLAFFGNAAFLVHVFLLKEKIDHNLAPPKSILPFNNFGMGSE
jgi:hypothetical protein